MDEILISSGHVGSREYLKVRTADGVTFYDFVPMPEIFIALGHSGPCGYLKVSAADGITLNADDVPYEMRLYAGFEPVAFANDDQFIMTMFAPQQSRYLQHFPSLANDHFEGEVESFFQ